MGANSNRKCVDLLLGRSEHLVRFCLSRYHFLKSFVAVSCLSLILRSRGLVSQVRQDIDDITTSAWNHTSLFLLMPLRISTFSVPNSRVFVIGETTTPVSFLFVRCIHSHSFRFPITLPLLHTDFVSCILVRLVSLPLSFRRSPTAPPHVRHFHTLRAYWITNAEHRALPLLTLSLCATVYPVRCILDLSLSHLDSYSGLFWVGSLRILRYRHSSGTAVPNILSGGVLIFILPEPLALHGFSVGHFPFLSFRHFRHARRSCAFCVHTAAPVPFLELTIIASPQNTTSRISLGVLFYDKST